MKKSDEHEALGFRRRMKIRDSMGGKFADGLTRGFGTVWFLVINIIFFIIWILINSGAWPIMPIFDPFPFTFLTMFVSLEAIILSVVVLISQNRASDIADRREELDFEINIQAEEEITRIITMLDEIHDHMGLDPVDDEELVRMKEKIDVKKLGDRLQNDRH